MLGIKIKKSFICLQIFLISLISCRNESRKSVILNVEYDFIMDVARDSLYGKSCVEILNMLERKVASSFKRAVFLLEWSYLKGNLDYENYCFEIETSANALRKFVNEKGISNYKTAGNFALFEFFIRPHQMNGYKPFFYNFEDFMGNEDYTKQFVTKLIRTHGGQCRSLPMFYKILADEIGAEAFLAQAPNHLYVKHLGEDKQWVNVELTNGHLVSDAYIVSSMAISAEAIRNKVYMDAMSEQESLAFLLYELSLGYVKKYGFDSFVLLCCDESLKFYPHNLPALMQKYNALRMIALEYMDKHGKKPDDFLRNNHEAFLETKEKIETLGYREMPKEQYLKWLQEMEAEKKKQLEKNRRINY